MPVERLTRRNFEQQVLRSDIPVVVDFYADWCGPCKQIGPVLEELSVRWAGSVRFAKVNIDEEVEIARAYRISSIPAVLRFEDGEVKNWCLGAKPGYLMERELRLTKRGVGGVPGEGERKGLLGRLLGKTREQ